MGLIDYMFRPCHWAIIRSRVASRRKLYSILWTTRSRWWCNHEWHWYYLEL